MDISSRLSISFYKTIAVLNEQHKIYVVQHIQSKKIYIKKMLIVYSIDIYKYLKANPIEGIPQIVEIYEENSVLTVIEEYISGQTLKELAENSVFDVYEFKKYIFELCGILSKLHRLSPPIVHRDIKPSNIIITPENHVVLIDFNAAKYFEKLKSRDTVLLGTQGYAAPEQYGFGSSTTQTDIYAVGILIKEMLSSMPPYTHDFDDIIKKATQMNPNDRYKDILHLQNAIGYRKNKNVFSVKEVLAVNLRGLKKFLPPGFRTGKILHIFVAIPIYALIIALSAQSSRTSTSIAAPVADTVLFTLLFLSVIFAVFNYMDIQRFMPLCKSQKKWKRYLGIVLLCGALIAWIIIVWIFIGVAIAVKK